MMQAPAQVCVLRFSVILKFDDVEFKVKSTRQLKILRTK